MPISNIYPPLPTDKSLREIQDAPSPKKANARYGAASETSSVISLTDDTTMIEVTAVGGSGVALRWIASSDTAASVIATGASANFDHVVPANWRQRFAVPQEIQATSSIVGAGVQNGLYRRVAVIKTASPASSVLTSEF